ncbi:LCN15 protein, partial [Eudromia elegans]|nr:LCN15 protein [Eudromia elegans]
MRAAQPGLALALLCVLRARAELPVQPGFEPDKFAGTWHIMAAVSNCPVFLSMKDKMKSSVSTFSFSPDGDLALKAVFPVADECKVVERHFQQEGQAGHYSTAGEEGKRDLIVVETDYEHYAIVSSVTERDEQPSATLQLYTRGRDVSPQLLEKFKELYPTMGLTDDMLAVMPTSGEWQPGSRDIP